MVSSLYRNLWDGQLKNAYKSQAIRFSGEKMKMFLKKFRCYSVTALQHLFDTRITTTYLVTPTQNQLLHSYQSVTAYVAAKIYFWFKCLKMVEKSYGWESR
jgi:hypothetical protein